MKHRSKVIIPGRPIDLLYTNVAETFKRVRAEQAKHAKQTAQVVKPIGRKKAA